jgi:hypothetical protein
VKANQVQGIQFVLSSLFLQLVKGSSIFSSIPSLLKILNKLIENNKKVLSIAINDLPNAFSFPSSYQFFIPFVIKNECNGQQAMIVISRVFEIKLISR